MKFEENEMQARTEGYETVIPGNSIDAACDLMLSYEFRFSRETAISWPEWRTVPGHSNAITRTSPPQHADKGNPDEQSHSFQPLT